MLDRATEPSVLWLMPEGELQVQVHRIWAPGIWL
jgi:hypothetical protein